MDILQKMFNFAYGQHASGLPGRSGKRLRECKASAQKAFSRKFSVSKSPKLPFCVYTKFIINQQSKITAKIEKS